MKTFNEEGDEIGNIERIVGHKQKRNGNILYLVKWQGFSSRHNTWESDEHLRNEGCQDSIADYWNQYNSVFDGLDV